MNPVAVVTGAARGIGLELCRQLPDRGFSVFACPRKSPAPDLEAVAHQRTEITIVPMDVSDPASVHQAAATIREATDRVDVLINNGAIYPQG